MKIPKLFKKTYKQKQFEKKVLKRLHVKEDREYVASLFTFDPDKGKYVFTGNVNKADAKRLKTLAKAIKKNKGVFVVWKLALVLILAFAIIGFNILFKNMILENLAERGLETVFGAPVEITALNAGLLKGEIRISAIEIGDKDRPGKNIIQTGPAVFSIDTAQALKKKIIINEASVEGIQTGTDSSIRKPWTSDSGKDAGKEDQSATGEKTVKKDSSSPLGKLPDLTGDFADFDYEGLIESQKENLASFKVLEEIKTDSEAMVKKWEGKLDESSKTIEEITNTAKKFADINPSSLTDVTKLQSLQKEIEASYNQAQDVRSTIDSLRTELDNDRKNIINRKKQVTTVFNQDYDYLRSFIDLPTSEKLSLVSGYASDYMGPELQTYYGYVLKGIDVLEIIKKYKKQKAADTKEKDKERRYQEFISFPSVEYPDILIKKIAGTFSGKYSGEGSIENISSDPDKAGVPTILTASFTGEDYTAGLNAAVDTRTDKNTFDMDFSIKQLPVKLDEGLEGLTLKTIEGVAKGSVALNLQDSYKNGKGDLFFVIENTEVTQTAGDSLIHEAIGSIFSDAVNIDAKGSFDISNQTIKNIKLDSSFDKILSEKIGAYIGEKAKEMENKLREEVDAYLTDLLGQYDMLDSILSEEDAEALSQIRSAADAENLIESKKELAQNKVDSIMEEADRIKREAEQKAKEEAERLKREAEEKAKAEADRLKREADQKAREAEEQAKREAEERAKKEADKLKNKVKIPGF